MRIDGGAIMDKIYKVIAWVAVIMCMILMVWNVFLLKENNELKNSSISIVEE